MFGGYNVFMCLCLPLYNFNYWSNKNSISKDFTRFECILESYHTWNTVNDSFPGIIHLSIEASRC